VVWEVDTLATSWAAAAAFEAVALPERQVELAPVDAAPRPGDGRRRSAVTSPGGLVTPTPDAGHHYRFHTPHLSLASPFGEGWFGEKAEAFARFFGTPQFLVVQTALVALWVTLNSVGVAHFDLYPFILLNLAFSLQSAYAAPLILLAQTRQADRDKANVEADARHREDLACASRERSEEMLRLSQQILELLDQNTRLTRLTQELSARIEVLTREIHAKVGVG
jgi:uncharacterized membrane protein